MDVRISGKEKPFSDVFTALGVEIGEALQQITADDALTPEVSGRLRGRLLFAEAEAHIFGRSAKIALRAIGEPGVTGRTTSPLDAKILFGLKWMLDRIINAPPRLDSTAW